MTLHIQVIDMPVASLELKVQGKKTLIEPVSNGDGLDFFVPIDIRADGRWGGDFVRDNRDGRWFIYLTWYNGSTIVKRIKLYTHQCQEEIVLVSGRDSRGEPACSTAVIVSQS